MTQRILHLISLLFLMAIATQGLVACADESTGDRDADGPAVLMLRTMSLDSRSGMSGMEKLNSLRVIILHQNGTLETNYYAGELGGAERHEHIFTVTGKETKKIYLVANEESMEGVDLNDLGANPAAKLEQITFEPKLDPATGNPELKNGIPMSACYELTVGGEPRVEKDFFLVRAMTKFTFTFQNGRSHDVTLKEMRVTSFADKTYLMPQFTDGSSAKVGSEKFMVDATGAYEAGSGLFWIDWLRDAIEKSQSGLHTPDEIGWIKDYRIPDGAVHDESATGIVLKGGDDCVINNTVDSWTYPKDFYRCESIYIPDGEQQQKYSISYLSVIDEYDGSIKEWKNRPILRLNQVKYLFRHTHVNVNVVFGQKDVVIFARIHPWIVIKPTSPLPLEPVE